jgi:large subunit ribosomal protein L30
MTKKLKITWAKSTINTKRTHRKTIRALGLKRLHHAVVHEDSPQVRGMIHAVNFLVRVEEVEA